MKSKLLRLSMILCLLLISITACANQPRHAFDVRDYVEIPAGTVIKNVPFYLNGKDKAPTLADYTTSGEGAYYSLAAEKVLR